MHEQSWRHDRTPTRREGGGGAGANNSLCVDSKNWVDAGCTTLTLRSTPRAALEHSVTAVRGAHMDGGGVAALVSREARRRALQRQLGQLLDEQELTQLGRLISSHAAAGDDGTLSYASFCNVRRAVSVR